MPRFGNPNKRLGVIQGSAATDTQGGVDRTSSHNEGFRAQGSGPYHKP